MRSGLEVLLDNPAPLLSGARVGFCCNHTAVDRQLRHGIDRLLGAGVQLVRLFAPEHGVRATAQDMETVGETLDVVSGIPTVSLYGSTAQSLHPDPATLADLDIVLFDIQDIGARYYTYQATLGYLMQAVQHTRVLVLDRPNPIDGLAVEGPTVQPGFESFVGAFPLAVRHGMTLGELGHYFKTWCGVDCDYQVIPCQGWARSQWFDQTGLPWVYPSPNMPTLATATIYPGMCLVEGTNLSEGRGTTRPFHLLGAPWLDPQRFTTLCEQGAKQAGLRGVAFRPAAFVPGFQKHAGTPCTGVEIHITDRGALHALLLGMVCLQAARACDPEHFGWRTHTYEFIDHPIAIDLLTGSSTFRHCIETEGSLTELLAQWEPSRQAFLDKRDACLLY